MFVLDSRMILHIVVHAVKRSPTKNARNANRCNTVIESVNACIGSFIRNCALVQFQHQMHRQVVMGKDQTRMQLKSVHNYSNCYQIKRK